MNETGTLPQRPSEVKQHAAVKTIIAVTPDLRCWNCEGPLPADFCGVSASTPMVELVSVLCGERCQAKEMAEVRSCGIVPRALGTADVMEILRSPERVRVLEAQEARGGFLVRYDRAHCVCAALLSRSAGARRWAN